MDGNNGPSKAVLFLQMAEMINVICPVCCAQVAHEGRIVRGPTSEFAKCAHGNVGDCIDRSLSRDRRQNTHGCTRIRRLPRSGLGLDKHRRAGRANTLSSLPAEWQRSLPKLSECILQRIAGDSNQTAKRLVKF